MWLHLNESWSKNVSVSITVETFEKIEYFKNQYTYYMFKMQQASWKTLKALINSIGILLKKIFFLNDFNRQTQIKKSKSVKKLKN